METAIDSPREKSQVDNHLDTKFENLSDERLSLLGEKLSTKIVPKDYVSQV